MTELTQEEKDMLAEIERRQVIDICSRKHGQTEEERTKLRILKELVYKDLISFSATPEPKRNYVFISRSGKNLEYR